MQAALCPKLRSACLCHKLGHKSVTTVAIYSLLRPRQTCYLIEFNQGAIKKSVLRIGCSTN